MSLRLLNFTFFANIQRYSACEIKSLGCERLKRQCQLLTKSSVHSETSLDLPKYAEIHDLDNLREQLRAELQFYPEQQLNRSKIMNQWYDGIYFTLLGADALHSQITKLETDPPIITSCVLADLIGNCVVDVSAHCIEKTGATPEFEICELKGSNITLPYAVEGYLYFLVCELLKNCVGSMVKRYGPLQLEDAPPVQVNVTIGLKGVSIIIEDTGIGATSFQSSKMFDWHHSSERELREPDYKYSRDFGAPLSGFGVGLSKARVLAAWHGGILRMDCKPQNGDRGGCKVNLQFTRTHLPACS
jgi:hypothetical protein